MDVEPKSIFYDHGRPKLLKILDFGKAKVLAIHLGQCMDPCKCVNYDYKVYIMCVSKYLYSVSITMGLH